MTKSLLAAILVLSLAAPAVAQSIAENMSCAQVIAQFERSGVVYKRAGGNTVVPVRGGVPVSRKGTLQCAGRGAVMTAQYARTTDRRRCEFAAICR